jgi:large subunit ribosomal protein L6
MPITIPAGVEVNISGQDVTVRGPKGTLSHSIAPPIEITRDDDGVLTVTRPNDERESRALHGLSRTLVANMVTGVTDGFTKELEIHGVGYRANAQGPRNLELALGFSHPVRVEAPEGIEFEVIAAAGGQASKIVVKGIDKEKVGQVAADIRKIRKPEPYKGKGVRYAGEHIIRKAGKTGK